MIFPPDFTYPAEKTAAASVAACVIAARSPRRGAVVQAGGCAGLWPLALADHFQQVFTFEPDPENFRCLRANVRSTPTISAYDYAVRDVRGYVGLTRPKPKAGLWQVEGDGDIKAIALDDVLLDIAVDAIVLDVEGSEPAALRGATRLIVMHRPLLWFEYLHHTDAIDTFLGAHGYVPAHPAFGSDYYSVHASCVVH